MAKIQSLNVIGVEQNEEELKEEIQKETVLELTIKELFGTEKLEMKTDLSEQLILAMSRGRIFADRYNSKTMSSLILNLQKLFVSKDRKSRGELVELFRNMQEPLDHDSETNFFRRMIGNV